jgi:hypothetical protein
MTVSQSKALSDDVKGLYSYQQRMLIDHEASSGYAAATAKFISTWIFPSYARILNARKDETLRLFDDTSCLFDYTERKMGGISGDYLTISNYKIAYFDAKKNLCFIQNTFETDYFEIISKGQLTVIEYSNANPQSPPRSWTVHNPLQMIPVDDKRELCYWGFLVNNSSDT